MLIAILMDFKVGPTKDDLETLAFMKSLGKEIVVILTKTDKVPLTHQTRQLKNIKGLLGTDIKTLEVSNQTKRNINQAILLFESRVMEVNDGKA